MAEYKQLLAGSAPEGIVAGPVSEDNFFEWEAIITGPQGTPFEDGVQPLHDACQPVHCLKCPIFSQFIELYSVIRR